MFVSDKKKQERRERKMLVMGTDQVSTYNKRVRERTENEAEEEEEEDDDEE